jgi:hypothetical protein
MIRDVYPGSRSQKSTGSRITDSDPQPCFRKIVLKLYFLNFIWCIVYCPLSENVGTAVFIKEEPDSQEEPSIKRVRFNILFFVLIFIYNIIHNDKIQVDCAMMTDVWEFKLVLHPVQTS